LNILLLRLRLIGDVVFTTPIVAALRRAYPQARISYLVEPAAAPIVAGNPLLDEVIVAPRHRGYGVAGSTSCWICTADLAVPG
jgi:heptosyltransferase-1